MVTKSYQVGKPAVGVVCVNIVTECCKCGQVFSGKVYTRTEDWNTILKEARKKVSSCHICGSKIWQKEEYRLWNVGKADTSLKKQLREKITMFESEECRASINKQMTKIKAVPDMKADNELAAKVKSDIPSIKAYIQQLIDLEIWIRFVEEQIVNLDEEQTEIKKARTYADALGAQSAKKKIEVKEKSLLEEIEKLKKKFNSTDWIGEVTPNKIVAPSRPRYLKEVTPEKPVAPIMKQPNFFNKKKVLAENERLQREYEKACQIYEHMLKQLEEAKSKNEILRPEYDNQMRMYHASLEIEKTRVRAEKKRLEEEGAIKKQAAEKELNKKIEEIHKKIEDLKNSDVSGMEDSYIEVVLKKEKDECLKLIKTICEARNKLFSANVIYPNYRDVCALSSFYEYFNSERCYELEGPNGAYNLYESECRGDSISKIFRTLEDINKNQVVLYRETSNMFKNLKSLVNLLKDATKAIAEIEENKITEKLVEETFEKYFKKNESFKEKIAKSVDDAMTYLK